jgi:glycosyltransferase involved in cell wall biosynthesis
VVHDGIDTDAISPNPSVSLTLTTQEGEQVTLTRHSEVITFVNRNLEPYRGYHLFMRALPEILERRPNARVLIVGGNEVSYGARPDPQRYGNRSWRQIFIDEVRPRMADADWARVHFLGNVPYQHFIPLLQLSTVHVYLTYPFVLSWSQGMSRPLLKSVFGVPVMETMRHVGFGQARVAGRTSAGRRGGRRATVGVGFSP